jgi:hypothetical protein
MTHKLADQTFGPPPLPLFLDSDNAWDGERNVWFSDGGIIDAAGIK